METARKRTTLTLEPAVTAWLAHQGPRIRPTSFEKCQNHSRRWLADWGNRALNEITTADLDKHLGKRLRTCSPGTVALDLKILKGFFQWAIRTGITDYNPTLNVLPPRVPERTPRALSRKEEQEVLAYLPPKWGNMVVFAIETGLRVRTICELTWEMVNLERGWMRLPGHCLKSGRQLEAPLSKRALELLKALAAVCRAEGRIFETADRHWIGRIWRNAVRKAGIPPCRFHDLRVTFFSRCRQRGVPIEVAMALSDHHSIAVAMKVYRCVDIREYLRAMGREETS